MKIISLQAKNVKRLKAVHINPDGTLQVITGKNAQGKTSVLDAIWLALGGGAASRETAQPVRDGEESAEVVIDLGDLKVTRTWTHHGKTSLKVTSGDGASYSSPQKMLDELVGRLSFDPLEFTRLSARDQVKALTDVVDLDVDIDELDARRQRLYDERTEIGRQGKAIGEVEVDESLPKVEESASAIIAELRNLQEMERTRTATAESLTIAEQKVVDLRAELANWEAIEHQRRKEYDALPEVAAGAVEGLEARLSTVEEANAQIRANNIARERKQQKDELRSKYEAASAQIEKLDKQKAAALAQANFPVDGLGFGDDGVTYNGVPFSQASSAEQIRVSLAMAMSLNPKLKVVRILDGSLLDAESMELIASMAAEKDYQVWVERVEDARENAVVIEDGSVKSA